MIKIGDLTSTEMGFMVLVTQIIFLYLRTLNIRYIDKVNLWGAIVTGNGIAVTWMVGISIGSDAMMHGNVFPIIMHLVGGSIGTYFGMRKELKALKSKIEKNG